MSEDLTTRILDGHEGNLDTAAFSPDSSLLVTTSDNSTARIWDAKTGAARAVLKDVSSAAFSPDGARILTVSGDKTAFVWDVPSGRRLFSLGDNGRPVAFAVFSSDGTRILTISPELPRGSGRPRRVASKQS